MLAEKHGEKEKQKKKKDYVKGVHKGPLSKEQKKSNRGKEK